MSETTFLFENSLIVSLFLNRLRKTTNCNNDKIIINLRRLNVRVDKNLYQINVKKLINYKKTYIIIVN